MAVTDPYCKSLMHFDGEDESPDFIDETGRIWTAHGSAQLDTAKYKFPPSSGYFNGVDAYIDTPATEDLDSGENDSTDEIFVILESLPNPDGSLYAIISQYDPSWLNFWVLYIWNFEGTTGIGIDIYKEGALFAAVGDVFPFELDTPYHIAVIRHLGEFQLYVGGQPVGDPIGASGAMPVNTGTTMVIGTDPSFTSFFKGWVDERRFSNGVARWTGPFTPPSGPYTGDEEPPSASPPLLRSLAPVNDETRVDINRPVSFILHAQNGDGVDIDSVTVQIQSEIYQNGDPEFSYAGDANEYSIIVTHPNWDPEETVTVKINASSLLGGTIDEKEYSFTTKWDPFLTRKGNGRIELFETGKYELSLLTIQEDWVRQGVARYTADLELWYGRYMNIPKADDVQLVVVAGDSVRRGTDVVENGYFKVRVGGSGSYIPMYEDTVIHLGQMYPNTKKLIGFELLVPEDAMTKGYVMFELQFTPKIARLWGQYPWGIGLYGSGWGIQKFHLDRIYYRSYVFDRSAWSVLETGIAASPSYRGEDKQW
jgi:hypothetical protein